MINEHYVVSLPKGTITLIVKTFLSCVDKTYGWSVEQKEEIQSNFIETFKKAHTPENEPEVKFIDESLSLNIPPNAKLSRPHQRYFANLVEQTIFDVLNMDNLSDKEYDDNYDILLQLVDLISDSFTEYSQDYNVNISLNGFIGYFYQNGSDS